MIRCKRASEREDVLVAIYRYEDWQLVSFKVVSPNNVKAIAWFDYYEVVNIPYTMSWIYLLQILCI